jgi:TRAP-type mannitol/chloroaromatic compound transport system substrate-binding protein
MRIPGLGGEVFRRAGGTPVTLPVSEIFTSLQTGAIDATEWVGPYNDITNGFHTVARYYYYPGWQEPAPALQAYVNRQAWDSLPPDLQSIIEISCQAITTDMQSEYTHGNAVALEQLMKDPNVELRRFPDDVLQYLKSITQEIVEEMAADDPMAAKIYKSWSSFLAQSIPNQRITEQAFLATRL